jgi:hypothetical protein
VKIQGIINVGFDVTDLVLIISALVRYWRKKLEYNETVHQLFIDFKKAYDSVRREVLLNILIELGNACYHSVQNLLSPHLLSKT